MHISVGSTKYKNTFATIKSNCSAGRLPCPCSLSDVAKQLHHKQERKNVDQSHRVEILSACLNGVRQVQTNIVPQRFVVSWVSPDLLKIL